MIAINISLIFTIIICCFLILGKDEECTGLCKTYEDTLLSIREDLVENTGGWVIRSYAPELFKFNGFKDSLILFMRNQRPIIYQGKEDDDEELYSYLINNKVSVVHNMTDDNFEV